MLGGVAVEGWFWPTNAAEAQTAACRKVLATAAQAKVQVSGWGRFGGSIFFFWGGVMTKWGTLS